MVIVKWRVKFSGRKLTHPLLCSLTASPAESPRKGAAKTPHPHRDHQQPPQQHNDSNSTLMHSPPSPKAHVDTVTLSAAGAASVLRDTANVLTTGKDACKAGHHSGPKRAAGVVDMHLISQQISELANRVDTLESSMKTDIRTILEILQQQQQQPAQQHQQLHYPTASRSVPRISPQQQPPPAVPERQMTSTYQTDSEYSSFDLGVGGGPDKTLQHQTSSASYGGGGTVAGGGGMRLTPTQHKHQQPQQQKGGNVQRSISQPECANERNLFT